MLLKVSPICNTIRRYVTALYVAGDKVALNYPGLRPYNDFNAKLQNKQELEQNIARRKMKMNLNEIQLLWSTYLDITKKKSDLEQRRKDIVKSVTDVDPQADGGEALIRKFKIEGAMAKNDLKSLKENSYAIEETFIHQFLDLPNDIHDRTPLEANRIYFSHSGQQIISDAEDHLNKSNYLKYHDPFCYFLRSDAAKCDLNLPFYCVDMFRSFGFIPFSNPDFIRTVLAEGAGVRVDDLMTIEEDDSENKCNLLHLAGSGSMLGFLGNVTKLKVSKSCLPLKFMSSGKDYTISDTNSAENGLYSACQTTNVQLFCMAGSESESLHQFDETLEQMKEFYKRLDRDFRITYVTADRLAQGESLRADFEMYSPHRKCFVTIGHLSGHGDYISKRLLIVLKGDNEKRLEFPHLISGRVINVTKFLALLLEEKGELRPPKILENLK